MYKEKVNSQLFPKPKFKRRVPRAKRNAVPTINDICRYTGEPYAQTHEVFFGSGERQLSIRYGLQVKVSDRIHKQIHANPLKGLDMELKQEYQQKFIDKHSFDEWMKIFGRNYLD